MKTTFKPGTKIRLGKIDPSADSGANKRAAREECDSHEALLEELAYRLHVEGRHAVLIVLQGMDTSGKDGVVRRVIDAINPQMCRVHSFKVPTEAERAQDFLWRHHMSVPPRGWIGIHNRSHYETVLVERVKKIAPEHIWSQRYELINAFEKSLTLDNVVLLKFFLHISKDEQRKRLLARQKDPVKQWKLTVSDIEERALWDEYQAAYEDALTLCNTAHSPWHVIPADRKWHRDLLISRILLHTLKRLDPQLPPANPEALKMKIT